MDVTVENILPRNHAYIGADVEALNGGISLGDVVSQTTEEVVWRRPARCQ